MNNLLNNFNPKIIRWIILWIIFFQILSDELYNEYDKVSAIEHSSVRWPSQNQFFLPMHQKIPHFKRFPSMYNTWGPRKSKDA